jgi:hypothetical protein
MNTRSIGNWELPQPTDLKEDNEWIRIPRIARTVPLVTDKTKMTPTFLIL